MFMSDPYSTTSAVCFSSHRNPQPSSVQPDGFGHAVQEHPPEGSQATINKELAYVAIGHSRHYLGANSTRACGARPNKPPSSLGKKPQLSTGMVRIIFPFSPATRCQGQNDVGMGVFFVREENVPEGLCELLGPHGLVAVLELVKHPLQG